MKGAKYLLSVNLVLSFNDILTFIYHQSEFIVNYSHSIITVTDSIQPNQAGRVPPVPKILAMELEENHSKLNSASVRKNLSLVGDEIY